MDDKSLFACLCSVNLCRSKADEPKPIWTVLAVPICALEKCNAILVISAPAGSGCGST